MTGKPPWGCENLVCLEALREATRDLEEAQLRCRQAALDLARVRKKLEQALDYAFREQSFGRLDPLFTKEEAALALYEQAALNSPKRKNDGCALRVALAYEKELMQEVQPSRKRLN